jgi:hypothetical protein
LLSSSCCHSLPPGHGGSLEETFTDGPPMSTLPSSSSLPVSSSSSPSKHPKLLVSHINCSLEISFLFCYSLDSTKHNLAYQCNTTANTDLLELDAIYAQANQILATPACPIYASKILFTIFRTFLKYLCFIIDPLLW